MKPISFASPHFKPAADPQFEPVTAAYVHIPFCRRRCYYCDFPISVVGDRRRGETSGTIAQYVEVLCHEILTTPQQGPSLQTVFFGGGTPSLLSVEQLQKIVSTLKHHFGLAATVEISMEMDPGTFDLAHVQGYQAAGVNRISLGVQAFQDQLLQACGRSHTVADIESAVDLLHQAGVNNFSLDLISGLPHQTLDLWQDSLERAIALEPQHLSVYDLTVEPMTPFGKQYEPGLAPLPSDELTPELYRLAQRSLTAAGYEHYEISNYAQPGYPCCHNRVYWENRPYYGFGMGAASYTQGQRFSRPRTRREYFQWVQDYAAAGGQIDCEVTSVQEQLLDTLMLGLRLAEGIQLQRLAQFGPEVLSRIGCCLAPYGRKGWVGLRALHSGKFISLDQPEAIALLSQPDTGHLCLSDPEGFLFSNVVLSELFKEFSDEADS